MYVEYGTTHSTDTCFHCWLEGFGEVEATHEIVHDCDERTALCARHAEDVLVASITIQ